MATPKEDVLILPLLASDIPTWVNLHERAFTPTSLGHVFYTRPLSASSRDLLASNRLSSFNLPTTYHFKAVDASSPPSPSSSPQTSPNKILGVAKWVIQPHPRTQPELDAALDITKLPPLVPEAHQPAMRAFQAALFASQRAVLGTRPFVMLASLSVDVDAQRRGVGAKLMRWGVEKADELGLVAYLEASDVGRGLYAKFGFEVVAELDFDASVYGAEAHGAQFVMVRQPRTRKVEETDGEKGEGISG